MQATACPDDAALRDLIAGKIDEISESSLAQHIQDCDHCRERAQQIELQRSDSILKLLQAKDGDSAYYGEPDCRWSTSRALAVIAGAPQDETQPDQFELPLELGDYRILESIAQGGMGVVYRAQHLRLGRDVAVKIISGRRLADRRAVQRFEAEMRTLGQLSHPNIVSAMDARELAGQPVLVMEYVDGMDLSKIAERLGPLPADIVAAIGAAVAKALDYANRNGLIHRDVKPSNVMINSSGQIKLLDLGLARLQASSSGDTTGTLTGLALGTADYMSPEQIHDARGVDPRADLYSLGCTLYKLLTGEAPYSGPRYATNFAKLQGHVSDEPINVPPQYREGCQPLVELIHRLTAKQRDNRPDSAAQVSEQLAELGQGANLAQLVSLAQKASDLSQAMFSSDDVPFSANRPGSSRQSIIPPWLRWTIAASSFPAGIALGIWLSIKKSDGTHARIQVPNGAAATVDPQGNVELSLGESASSDVAGNSPSHREPVIVQSMPFQPSMSGTVPTPESELPKIWSRQPSLSTPQLGQNQQLQNAPLVKQSIDDRELDALMKNSNGTQAIYRGYNYEQWLGLLDRERDVDTACVAVRALIELAQSPEQQRQVADQVMQKSRIWGSIIISGSHPEGTWMETFLAEVMKLDPVVLLASVAEELEDCNKHSFFACYWTMMGIADANAYSIHGTFERDWHMIKPESLPSELVLKLYFSLESSRSRLQIEKEWKDSFTRYVVRLTGAIQLPFSELPTAVQTQSKRSWERLASTELTQIHRSGYPQNPKPSDGDFESLWLPTARDWRPYWSSLPADQRQPLRILHQIFQDQVLTEPELNLQETLAALTVVSDDEKQKIKQFLAQRLADSDFDNPQDSRRIVWPEILKWCVQMGVIDEDTADQALRIVDETSSSIATIVGDKVDVLAISRQRTGIAGSSMSSGMSGSPYDPRIEVVLKNSEAIYKLLEQATLRLAESLELPADMRQFSYRLPGTPSANEPQNHGAMGGGMF